MGSTDTRSDAAPPHTPCAPAPQRPCDAHGCDAARRVAMDAPAPCRCGWREAEVRSAIVSGPRSRWARPGGSAHRGLCSRAAAWARRAAASVVRQLGLGRERQCAQRRGLDGNARRCSPPTHAMRHCARTHGLGPCMAMNAPATCSRGRRARSRWSPSVWVVPPMHQAPHATRSTPPPCTPLCALPIRVAGSPVEPSLAITKTSAWPRDARLAAEGKGLRRAHAPNRWQETCDS